MNINNGGNHHQLNAQNYFEMCVDCVGHTSSHKDSAQNVMLSLKDFSI